MRPRKLQALCQDGTGNSVVDITSLTCDYAEAIVHFSGFCIDFWRDRQRLPAKHVSIKEMASGHSAAIETLDSRYHLSIAAQMGQMGQMGMISCVSFETMKRAWRKGILILAGKQRGVAPLIRSLSTLGRVMVG